MAIFSTQPTYQIDGEPTRTWGQLTLDEQALVVAKTYTQHAEQVAQATRVIADARAQMPPALAATALPIIARTMGVACSCGGGTV